MKILYLDCQMGAAGDMLSAAIYELLPDKERIIERLNALQLPGITFSVSKAVKCGIAGTHFDVLVDGRLEAEPLEEHIHAHEEHAEHKHDADDNGHGVHSHRGYRDIISFVENNMKLDNCIKQDILAVYKLIGEAESKVHNTDIKHIHFHEVGTLDAIADVTAFCFMIRELGAEEIVVSPVHVGKGTVHCAHGILPVPAPATAEILRGVPIYAGDVTGELCTPTGAAIIKHFAKSFGSLPEMSVNGIGYGMGRRDYEQANCVRAILGETADSSDYINEISCNIDDMTGEDIGSAMDFLYEGGAVEVFTIPVSMKKNRPGILLKVLCGDDAIDNIVYLIFKHTTTVGIRRQRLERCVLERRIEEIETQFGVMRKKICSGYGTTIEKVEHDDLVKAAKNNGLSIEDVRKILKISD